MPWNRAGGSGEIESDFVAIFQHLRSMADTMDHGKRHQAKVMESVWNCPFIGLMMFMADAMPPWGTPWGKNVDYSFFFPFLEASLLPHHGKRHDERHDNIVWAFFSQFSPFCFILARRSFDLLNTWNKHKIPI